MLALDGGGVLAEIMDGNCCSPLFLFGDQCAVSRYLARERVGRKLLENCHVCDGAQSLMGPWKLGSALRVEVGVAASLSE